MGLADDVRTAGRMSLQDALHDLCDAANTVAARMEAYGPQMRRQEPPWETPDTDARTAVEALTDDIGEVFDYVDAATLAEHLIGRGWHNGECVVDAEIVEDPLTLDELSRLTVGAWVTTTRPFGYRAWRVNDDGLWKSPGMASCQSGVLHMMAEGDVWFLHSGIGAE